MTVETQHKWAVTGQEEHPTIGPDGLPATEHHVHFKVHTGEESHITLPDHQYSAVNVHQAIEHKANELIKVHHLHAGSKPTEPGQE